MSNNTGFEIAIIGMDLSIPMAENINEFWNNLKSGKDCITRFSDEELIKNGVSESELQNKNYVKANGVMNDVLGFDYNFFNYSSTESKAMDPQLRKLYECTWRALEDGGYNSKVNNGKLCGCYIGADNSLAWQSYIMGKNDIPLGLYDMTLINTSTFFSTQLAYKFNFKGPCITLQSACSSSLVAVHLACQSLLNGECDLSIAGGVTATYPDKVGYMYQEGALESSDGCCRSFDDKGNGSVSGEGVGVVLLKRLEDAIDDKDHIYAVIKATAVNNDGKDKVGFVAPSSDGQSETIKTAIQISELDCEQISYIEAHGTATKLGDTLEVEGFKKAFKTDKKNYCAISSAKSNIGHLGNASGVVGLIKTALQIMHRQLVPTVHFEKLNKNITLDNTPFYIQDKLSDWTGVDGELYAGVNSFGIGGTNAHIILTEAPSLEVQEEQSQINMLAMSAKTSTALNKYKEKIEQYLQENSDVNIDDMGYTLACRRKNLKSRYVAFGKNSKEIINNFSTKNNEAIIENGSIASSAKRISNVLVLSDDDYNNLNHIKITKKLYREDIIFKDNYKECINIIKSKFDIDIEHMLYFNEETKLNNDNANKNLENSLILFAFQYSLVKCLKSYGIDFNMMLGYGVGEFSVACLCENISLSDAIDMIYLKVNNNNLSDKGIDIKQHLLNLQLKKPTRTYVSSITGTYINEDEVINKEYWFKIIQAKEQEIENEDIINLLINDGFNVFIEVGQDINLSQNKLYELDKQDISILDLLDNDKYTNILSFTNYMNLLLAKLWVHGIDIDWEKIYGQRDYVALSLPLYCFDREKDIHDLSLESNKNLSYDEKPKNQKEQDIIDAFKIVVGDNGISVNDNYFTDLGGNSLQAINIVGILSHKYMVNLNQIFEYPTARELAKNIASANESLKQHLDEIKQHMIETMNVNNSDKDKNKDYIKSETANELKDPQEVQEENNIVKDYLNSIHDYDNINFEDKINYKNILLTGATGYLGAYLLKDLLKLTELTIYVTVRGGNLSSCKQRLKDNVDFYFPNLVDSNYNSRVIVVKSDASNELLGMDENTYDILSNIIDCIIHCAGNSSHFGNYGTFEKANVNSAKNLIEFAKLNRAKDIDYISTLSVFQATYDRKIINATEDMIDIGQKEMSVYPKSKFEAEKLLNQARKENINVNIFRLGNISFNSENGSFQRNIEQNAVFSVMKAFIQLGAVPDNYVYYDYGYVDYISKAIAKLYNVKEMQNRTYHISNSQYIDLAEILSCKDTGLNVKKLNLIDFINYIEERLDDSRYNECISVISTHLLGTDNANNSDDSTRLAIHQERSEYILSKVGIYWDKPNEEKISKYINYCKSTGSLINW